MDSRKRIVLPRGLGLSKSGSIEMQQRGHLFVQSAGKAPKRRFSPGQFIWVEKQLWEIICAFRTASDPSEWLYTMEERQELKTARPTDIVGQALVASGAGSETPRVVHEVFRSSTDAYTFFADIVTNGDQRTFSNKELLQKKAEVRSSGEVLDPTSITKQK